MTRPCSYRNSRQGPRRLAFGSLICGNGQISKTERARVAVAAARCAPRVGLVRPAARGGPIANRAYIRTCKIMSTMNRTASVFIRAYRWSKSVHVPSIPVATRKPRHVLARTQERAVLLESAQERKLGACRGHCPLCECITLGARSRALKDRAP